MVQLTVTPAAKAAIEEYSRRQRAPPADSTPQDSERLEKVSHAAVGTPIDHQDLVDISRYLVENSNEDEIAREWRLDTLLKGATVYQPPPPPKPEPVCPELLWILRDIHTDEMPDARV